MNKQTKVDGTKSRRGSDNENEEDGSSGNENDDQYYDESEGNNNTPGDGNMQKGDGIFNRDEQMKYKKILEK